MMPLVMMASLSADFEAGVDPHARLAALDDVLLGAVLRRDGRQLVAQRDQVVVLVEPVVEDRELIDDLLLYLVLFHIVSFVDP